LHLGGPRLAYRGKRRRLRLELNSTCCIRKLCTKWIYIRGNHISLILCLTKTTPTAIARALVRPDPALVSIGVLAGEPPIQGLLQVIKILRLAITLSLGRARIALGQALITIEPGAGLEPAVVATNGGDGIVPGGVELRLQVVGAGVDVVLNRIRAHAVGVVLARYLHQARRRPAGVRLAGGFLHGDEGEDDGVDAVSVAAYLEVLVILLAVATGAGVEGWAVDMVHGGEVQERGVPAIAIKTGVKPIFGSSVGCQLYCATRDIGKNKLPIRTSSRCDVFCGPCGIWVDANAWVRALCTDKTCNRGQYKIASCVLCHGDSSVFCLKKYGVLAKPVLLRILIPRSSSSRSPAVRTKRSQ
jgi:hypothetical protein